VTGEKLIYSQVIPMELGRSICICPYDELNFAEVKQIIDTLRVEMSTATGLTTHQ